MSFLGELKSRKVFRVGGAYIVAAWALIQVAATIFPQLALPDWAPTLVTVVLIVGFPVALLLAWFYEITPEGIRRTPQVGQAQYPASRRSAVTYFTLVGGLFVLALYLAHARYMARFEHEPLPETRAPGATDALPSVAVLPFVDMSPDGSQAYFGDGIAEELLNELARLDGLLVAGRTSSFAYKGSNLSIPAIGQALKVQSVLEGSIRKDANRLRITAQLIDSTSGYHLWSNTFDHDFSDVFMIQEEIAKAITGALGVKLGVGGSNEFKGAGTRNVEAYELYLKGSAQMFLDKPAAQRLLDQAISLDPQYAAAWAVRGISTAALMWDALPQDAPAHLDKGFNFIQRAVELDPDSWQVLTQYGTVLWGRTHWIAAHETYLKALAMREDRLLYNQYANMLARTGRLTEARIQFDKAEETEPLDGRPADLRMFVSLAQGRFEEAHAVNYWRPPSVQNAPPVPKINWAIAINAGNREDLQASLPNRRSESGSAELLYLPIAENVNSPQAALAIIRSVYADESAQWPTKLDDIAQFAAFFGDPELALEAKSREARLTVVRLHTLWYPVMAEVRDLPGFKQLMLDLNLVEYWRQYGWADYCHPLAGVDFTCSRVAP